MVLPLHGVRVLEFAQLFPGPYAGLILRELGADVVKVEPPTGDPTRAVPPFVGTSGGGAGALFCALNRGKRSVVLDLKQRADVEKYRKLARACRIVVDGYRAGVADRLGAGFDALALARTDLIYVALTGFGPVGPMLKEPGHDVTYQAWMGALDPGRLSPPTLPVADAAGALWAALLAVAHLAVPGNHKLEASLAGALKAPLLLDAALLSAGAGRDPVREGTAGYNVYACQDGKLLALGALETHLWELACGAFGDKELVDLGHPARADHADAIRRVGALIGSKPRDEWLARLRGARVPAAPVRSVAEALAAPLLLGSWDPPGVERAQDLQGAPRLGEHTDEVLAEIGNDASHR